MALVTDRKVHKNNIFYFDGEIFFTQFKYLTLI